MSTDATNTGTPSTTEPGTTEPGTQGSGCQPCDLEGFDGLACRAKKYAKQAEVMTQVAIDLEKYKKQYGESRTAFAEAWEAAAAERAEIQKQLDEIYELLDCRLEPEDKECLDKAGKDVFDDLEACSPEPGCCVGECTFDDAVGEDDDAADLTARIEKFRRETTANTDCFTALVGEPAQVASQVAKIKNEVSALATEVASGDKAKLAKWYARWMIATYRLKVEHLGHGFSSVSAYSDCLCRSLQCIASGWAAIAVLEGARAELLCLEGVKAAECTRKSEATLESILEAYECCREDEDGTPEQKPPEQTPTQTAP